MTCEQPAREVLILTLQVSDLEASRTESDLVLQARQTRLVEFQKSSAEHAEQRAVQHSWLLVKIAAAGAVMARFSHPVPQMRLLVIQLVSLQDQKISWWPVTYYGATHLPRLATRPMTCVVWEQPLALMSLRHVLGH